MRHPPLALLLAAAALHAQAAPQDPPLYQASSAEEGLWFKVAVEETQRGPAHSVLHVTGARGKADADNWQLCASARLATLRGFSHLLVMGPKTGDDSFTVGFYQAATDPVAPAFGPGYDATRLIAPTPAPAAGILQMCQQFFPSPTRNPR